MFGKKFSSNIRRRKRMMISTIILLVVFLGIGYAAFTTDLSIGGTLNVSKYDHTLYGVLEKAARKGYANEYTGAHHDSFTEEPSEKIYHWYAPNTTAGNTLANEILDKNNVIFAGHCWQMVRTTDTGGVKMIYNGESENEQCLNTRGNHVGYAYSSDFTNMYASYYYGTEYTYDKVSGTFSLAGTVTTGTVQSGQYTCKSDSLDDSCTALYLVGELISDSTYSVLMLMGNSHYSQFGKLEINTNDSSLSDVGYMYNLRYPYDCISRYGLGILEYLTNPMLESDYNIISNDTTSPFVFDSTTNMWTSTMHQSSSSASIVFNVPSDDDYLINYTISSEVWDEVTFYKNGTKLKDDSGIHSGTVNFTGLTTSDEIEVEYSKNDVATDGSDSVSFSMGSLTGETVDNRCQFGNSVEYVNGEYKLIDTIRAEPSDLENEYYLDSHHYTCFTSGDTCTKVSYIYDIYPYVDREGIYYIELENGKTVEAALNDMLTNDNVNQINSKMKKGIDAWYKYYMTEYSSYLEDTVFCNNRSIYNLGGFDPNGSLGSLIFNNELSGPDLSCTNITDKFSISNTKAQLTYPVGLLTYYELDLLNNSKLQTAGKDSWLISPQEFTYIYGATGAMSSNRGGFAYAKVSYDFGVRPVVSLKPGTEYQIGTGSRSNPYYVGEVYNITSSSNLVPKKSPPDYTVTLGNEDYAVTSFKLDGTLINGDNFVMPHHDVTIADVQYVQAYYTITNTDPDVTVPSSGRYGSTIELTSDNYRIDSFKVNGTLTTGNSFIMPAQNVTITDIQKTPQVVVESEHDPYANNINNVTYYENTFTGATSLTVELTYQTESTSWDWIYLYDDPNSSTPFNNKKYGGTTLKTETLTIPSNYLKIVFKTDSSGNNFYGFKAVIVPNYS